MGTTFAKISEMGQSAKLETTADIDALVATGDKTAVPKGNPPLEPTAPPAI